MAQEIVARFGIDAEKNGNEQHHTPCQHDGNARVPADHREKFPRGLARGNPPGQQRCYTRRERKGQQFAGEPALNLWAGFFPHEIISGQQTERQRHPAIHGGLLVEPGPSAKQDAPVVCQRQPGQQEQPQNGVAKHGHKNRDQTQELEPVPRGHSFTTSTHGLFGQEVQSTAVAIHGCSPRRRDTYPRSPSAYCVCRSKNYWSEGQFWSRSFFLHKSFSHVFPAKYAVPSPRIVLSPRPRRSVVAHRAAFRVSGWNSRPAQRNQEAGAPAWRPSSCRSSSCFCRSALRFSSSFNWAFLS